MKIIGILLVISLLLLTCYQIYKLIKEIRLKKKKSTTEENKEKEKKEE